MSDQPSTASVSPAVPAGLYAGLVTSSTDAVLVADAAGRYVDANPAACALLGYSRADLLTLAVPDVVAARPGWAQAQYAAYLVAGSWRGELEVRRRDGAIRSVESVVTAVQAGERTLHVAVLRDISARVEAQSASRALLVDELRAARDLDEQLFTGSPLAMVLATPEAIVLRANPACCALLGYAEEALLGMGLGELTHPDDLAESLAARPRLADGTLSAGTLEKRYLHADGHVVDTIAHWSSLRRPDGSVYGVAAVLVDVTERRAAEQALSQQRAFTDAVLDEIDVGVAAVDQAGTLTVFNRFSRERTPAIEVGMAYADWRRHYRVVGADGVGPLPDEDLPLARALGGERVRDAELRLATPTGDVRRVMMSARPIINTDNIVLGAVMSSMDVTARRAAEAALLRQTLQDPLTGVGNRALLLDRLQHALERLRRRPEPFAVVVLNLDDFKAINDTLGHGAGDTVLAALGARLRQALRAEDTVARLGGDEFAVVLPGASRAAALRLAEVIREATRAPVVVEGREFSCDASMGVVVASQGDSADQLLRDADLAMYAAKLRGRGTIALFEPSMHTALVQRQTLDTALREALLHDQLRLAYQPIVDLVTGRLHGFEALCRWQHPAEGEIGPARFIPRAEATGLIVPLGAWVLARATRQAVAWWGAHPGLALQVMSVNVSAHQLHDPAFVDTVSSTLSESGLAPELLTLEVTESAVMSGAGLDALDRLHDLGVRLAVDDFGTGFSSLSRLHSLPFEVVKIDRSFVETIGPGGSAPIVTATLGMARALGLRTVTEGVETAEQADFLRENGCDRAQGYYFWRPAEVDAVDALLTGEGVAPRVRALRRGPVPRPGTGPP